MTTIDQLAANPPDAADVSRVLHGDGEPAAVPTTEEELRAFGRRTSRGEMASKMDQRRARALKELGVEQPEVAAQPAQPAQPAPVEQPPVAAAEPAQPTPTEQPAPTTLRVASTEAPISQPEGAPLTQEDLTRAMAAQQDQHRREMDLLRTQPPASQPAPQAAQPPAELPDPDTDPGGYAQALIKPIQSELAEERRLRETQAQQHNLERVQGHVRGKLDEYAVFNGRKTIRDGAEHEILQGLFVENNLGAGNFEAIADQRVHDLAIRYEGEIGVAPPPPSVAVPAAQPTEAQQVAEQMQVNRAPTSVPEGAVEGNGFTAPKPAEYNHSDPEQRMARSKAHLEQLAARRGMTGFQF